MPAKKWIDISWPITGAMPSYRNDPDKKTHITHMRSHEIHGSSEHVLTLPVHAGTHVDAPYHMLATGKKTDTMRLDMFIGPCIVIDFSRKKENIGKEDLAGKKLKKRDIVLLKTRNSEKSSSRFDNSFIALAADGAAHLAKLGVKAVGIDYLGIERGQPGHETHKTLFRHDIGIIEGLRLRGVKAGRYSLYCLPLSLPGMDGAPARALLHK